MRERWNVFVCKNVFSSLHMTRSLKSHSHCGVLFKQIQIQMYVYCGKDALHREVIVK